jgi:hypothetical protein
MAKITKKELKRFTAPLKKKSSATKEISPATARKIASKRISGMSTSMKQDKAAAERGGKLSKQDKSYSSRGGKKLGSK